MVYFDSITRGVCPEDRTDAFVLDICNAVGEFNLRIDDPILMFKERRQDSQGDAAKFVDCKSTDGSSMLFEPCGIVGPPTQKADAVGSPGDYDCRTN